jgi:hypothetical protein
MIYRLAEETVGPNIYELITLAEGPNDKESPVVKTTRARLAWNMNFSLTSEKVM